MKIEYLIHFEDQSHGWFICSHWWQRNRGTMDLMDFFRLHLVLLGISVRCVMEHSFQSHASWVQDLISPLTICVLWIKLFNLCLFLQKQINLIDCGTIIPYRVFERIAWNRYKVLTQCSSNKCNIDICHFSPAMNLLECYRITLRPHSEEWKVSCYSPFWFSCIFSQVIQSRDVLE